VKSKRILYLSFYFEPDLCAGSFRNSPLVKMLSEKFEGTIDLITTLPNRYESYSAEAPSFEERGNLNVHRIALPPHQSGMADQIKSFKVYFDRAKEIVQGKQYDLVFASSSRLFTAYLGARMSRKFKAPLYLDIRDIFFETIRDILTNPLFRAAGVPLIKRIEKFTFNSATHINLVSGGFKSYFEPSYKANYSYFTNGIDEVFIDAGRKWEGALRTPPTIVYAGNFGEGQGLHSIIPEFALKVGARAKIKLIGDGGMKARLYEEVESRQLSNVELLPPVSRNELIREYQQADILFVHLNDYDAFKRVLPSKIFEYGALNKPVLAGVGGFCAQLLKEDMDHAEIFPPCDADAMLRSFNKLVEHKERFDRTDFIAKYRRSSIVERMTDDILSYVR
jgi:glycosyltransferase involved in cell wall biosynthesis